MISNLLKILRLIGGSILIFIGIIGLFIPVLQGWLIIFLGLAIINPAFGKKFQNKFKEWREKLKKRK